MKKLFLLSVASMITVSIISFCMFMLKKLSMLNSKISQRAPIATANRKAKKATKPGFMRKLMSSVSFNTYTNKKPIIPSKNPEPE